MTIGRDQVLHAARLAEIAVADSELDELVADRRLRVAEPRRLIGNLLPVVRRGIRRSSRDERRDGVSDDDGAAPYLGGPAEVRLREDVVRPAPLAHPVSGMAPEFAQGFFLVPRRGTMDDEA